VGSHRKDEADDERGRDDRHEFDDAELLDESWDDTWDEGSGEGGPGRRHGDGGGLRWLLLLLVIPVVALVVLQLQPDQNPSASATPTPSTAPSPTVVPSNQPNIGIPHPTAPSTPTGGAPSVRRVRQHLLGITGDWDLFARGGDVVARIQPAQGRVTTTTVPALESTGPVSFLATSAGAIVRPLDGVTGYLVPDGKPARELTGALGFGGPVVPGPDADQVWVEVGNAVDNGEIRLVGLDGRPVGPSVPMPANAQGWIMPDGGGYPLIDTTGGVYDVRPGGLHRITTGTVEAVGPTGWLAVECDGRNRCARVVIDRATDDRRTLPGVVDGSVGVFGDPGSISPDGSAAVVFGGLQEPGQLRLVDLESGQSRALANGPATQGPSTTAVAWSPDGSRLFVASGDGALLVVDPDAPGHAVTLGIKLPDVTQLAVRPAHP
jgi:hypothetical protein